MKKMGKPLFRGRLLGWLLIIIAGILILIAQVLGDEQLYILGMIVLIVAGILNMVIETKRRRERQKNDDTDDPKE